MSIEFKLPELGENIESGDIVNLLVRQGDTIEDGNGEGGLRRNCWETKRRMQTANTVEREEKL